MLSSKLKGLAFISCVTLVYWAVAGGNRTISEQLRECCILWQGLSIEISLFEESVMTRVTDPSHHDFCLPRHNSPACPVKLKNIACLENLWSAPSHWTEIPPVPTAESIALALLGDPLLQRSGTNDCRNMALSLSKKPALMSPFYVATRDFFN